MALQTVRYRDLILEIPPDIYEPDEDSFLLADHALSLKGRILEMGCGSGMVSLANAKRNPGNGVLGIDINPIAVQASIRNAALNGIRNAHFIQSDLFSALGKSEKFDAIIFNPPYLVKEADDPNDPALYGGGKQGRGVIDRFIAGFPPYLSKGGVVLLIHSSDNDPEKTARMLAGKGFSCAKTAELRFFFEKLFLLEIRKK
ncbi:MAG: HemK2/MTQ2 family protein methyltransferase [Candidatus Bilamarchaeaceae archaeon]